MSSPRLEPYYQFLSFDPTGGEEEEDSPDLGDSPAFSIRMVNIGFPSTILNYGSPNFMDKRPKPHREEGAVMEVNLRFPDRTDRHVKPLQQESFLVEIYYVNTNGQRGSQTYQMAVRDVNGLGEVVDSERMEQQG